MKTLALAFFVFCVATLCRAANPSLENFDQLYFKTNAPAPGIIQTRMNTNQFRSPVLPGDTWTITNVTGLTGASHWTNVAGVLQPVDGSSVLVTNLTATSNTVNVGTMTWLSKSIVLTNGVNYLPSGKYSQLQLISPSTDPSLVQIVLSNGWSTVQHLEIFNLTNAVPSQGAFTLTNLTPIPDSLGGGVVKLINGENWVATNGCGIELRFISPDWVEQFRSDVSGNPTFISNTFNNITVISNTTLRGRITINNVSITTNTLWTTNVVAGVVNLQPVDLTEQPMVKNGWFVGTNSQTLWGSALGSDWALVSVADATKGEGGRGLSIASTDGNFSTNYSQITLSTVTNTAGLTLLSSDGSNDSVVSLQSQQATGGGGVLDIKFGGTNFVHIEPGITNGSPIAQFGSSITHSTGNLFELANNTTNRVVVTPLSTLIGSPVTSPNFSVPAALQVSNFEDRGKALTVDIKLGASGNNDDYPVYFYSQITNSSAHPTINMEEVSPSGYIGGAHTLLSVQETPKVTNTVSTWPTYAAASTTAGYFNAAPTGGTNGAAMGLQGSVDPTRNFINIGVGSYVEATTDNLAATNIAFSGTVNQVLGTQKAVGGLFEIGSLANIPSIPSSAGVLIDGHNSGAPLIIAQTNGAVQFKVAANSGYAGAGTTFLADDGTYKAAGGGGGSALWTTNGAGNVLLSDQSKLVVYTNQIHSGSHTIFSGYESNVWTYTGDFTNTKPDGVLFQQYIAGTNQFIYPFEIDFLGNGYTGGDANGLFIYSAINGSTNYTFSPLYFGNAIYAITAQANSESFAETDGASAVILANASGYYKTNFGLVSYSQRLYTNTLSVGVAGTVQDSGLQGRSIGAYFEVLNAFGTDPALNEGSVLLLDNRDSGLPLIIGRTNNGTHVFEVAASGLITATALTTTGTVTTPRLTQLWGTPQNSGTNIVVDFASVYQRQFLALTNDAYFTGSNTVSGASVTVRITSGSTNRNLTYDTSYFSTTNWIGAPPLTFLASNHIAVLTFDCVTNSPTTIDVYASPSIP